MADEIEAVAGLATATAAARAIDHPSPGHGPHAATCANCAAPLTGPFCGQCGQRAHLHRSIGDVFHEFLHGITHFDGKAWTTLPMLLFQPGTLTRSYIEGQRARYIAPVPLFLLVVFLMFFLLSFASLDDNFGANAGNGNEAAVSIKSDEAGLAKALAELDAGIAKAKAEGDTVKVAELESGRRLVAAVGVPNGSESLTDRLSDELAAASARGELKAGFGVPWVDAKANKALKNPRLMLYKLQSKAYKLSFLLVPLSLPWLWLVFVWRRGVGMYDHAIFTLYSISFMSLMFITASMLLSAQVTSEYVWLPLLLAPGAHMFMQLRGAYGLGWFSAGWRTVYLSLAALMTLSVYLVILILAGVLD